MIHIRRMSDMLNEKFDKYNQNMSFRHCAEDGDFGVRIAKVEGNTEYKAGENVDYLADFVNACKGMAETCNGSLEVSMDSNFEYNVYITDENDNMYASINFLLVYFNEENLEPIEELFDKNYLNEGRSYSGARRIHESINLPNLRNEIDPARKTFTVNTTIGRANVVWEVKPVLCNGNECDMSARIVSSDSPEYKEGDDVYITVPVSANAEDVATIIVDTLISIRNGIMADFNESVETSEKYTLEHPYVVNLPKGDYYIWEDFFGEFKGTANIENARARISDARATQTFYKSQGFKTVQDVAEYVIKYFK